MHIWRVLTIILYILSLSNVFSDECSWEKGFSLEITSPLKTEGYPGEALFVSVLVCNKTPSTCEEQIRIRTPEGWHCFPSELADISLLPEESKLLIHGVKIPKNALAGEHAITLILEGSQQVQGTVTVLVTSTVDIKGTVEGLSEAFPLNRQVQLRFLYTNNGNAALQVAVDAYAQPFCQLEYMAGNFEIPPYETREIPMIIAPGACLLEEFSQFLLVKLINIETGELLYQNPVTLKFVNPGVYHDDPYIHIPAHFRMMALGDRYERILAAEYAGGGLIDAERERYLDFFFRAPTDMHHVIYNIDQRLFAGMYDREWDIRLGDTIYALSPLTQRYRYGRGAGVQYFGINAAQASTIRKTQ